MQIDAYTRKKQKLKILKAVPGNLSKNISYVKSGDLEGRRMGTTQIYIWILLNFF